MKLVVIAVLMAIIIGAMIYTVQHPDDPASTAPSSGWMQR
jgi:hypothetical protein